MTTRTRLMVEIHAMTGRIIALGLFVLPILLAACTEGDGGGGGEPGY